MIFLSLGICSLLWTIAFYQLTKTIKETYIDFFVETETLKVINQIQKIENQNIRELIGEHEEKIRNLSESINRQTGHIYTKR